MLEQGSRSINLAPSGRQTISWRVTGIGKGNTSLTVSRDTVKTKVVASRNRADSLTASFFRSIFSSPGSELKVSTHPGRLEASWETPRGKVKIVKKPGKLEKSLETENYRFSIVRKPSSVIKKYISSRNSYRKVIRNRKIFETGVKPSGLTDISERLKAEVRKLENFIRQQELKEGRKLP